MGIFSEYMGISAEPIPFNKFSPQLVLFRAVMLYFAGVWE